MNQLATQTNEVQVEKLWEGIKVNECGNCKNEKCEGRLCYDNLCSNVNYLKMYGRENYEQNRETFVQLKKIMGNETPSIFSFGCGIGLDLIGATEVFGSNGVYYPIDECEWAILKTENYRNFEPRLPKRMLNFKEGMMLLSMTTKNPVLCFFHSLYTIKKEVDLKSKLISVLKNKRSFYFVCNFTINNHFGPCLNERDFIADLMQELNKTFSLKKFEILNDRGIIISGTKR